MATTKLEVFSDATTPKKDSDDIGSLWLDPGLGDGLTDQTCFRFRWRSRRISLGFARWRVTGGEPRSIRTRSKV